MVVKGLEAVQKGGAACCQRGLRRALLKLRQHIAFNHATMRVVHPGGDIGGMENAIQGSWIDP